MIRSKSWLTQNPQRTNEDPRAKLKWILPWNSWSFAIGSGRGVSYSRISDPPQHSVGLTNICWILRMYHTLRYVTPEESNNKPYFLLLQVLESRGFYNKWTKVGIYTKYFMTPVRVINNDIFTVLCFGTWWGAITLASDGYIPSK